MAYLFHTIFYQPIFNLLIFLYNIIPGHDLAFAIIILTIIIKLILLPLSKQSIKSQKALQELQPKIEELKKQHGSNKEEMARATMALYKENKVNPFSSCLPLLLQLPFFFAVFQVFRDFNIAGNVEKYIYTFVARPEVINVMGFFGFVDLSKRSIPLAVLAGLAQFWQAKMMMTKQPNPVTPGAKDENITAIMNKQMLYMMPALTVFIGVTMPGGLSLYWLTITLLTALQQLYVFKHKDKTKEVVVEVIK